MDKKKTGGPVFGRARYMEMRPIYTDPLAGLAWEIARDAAIANGKPEEIPPPPDMGFAEHRRGESESGCNLTMVDWFAAELAATLADRFNAKDTAPMAYNYAEALVAERESRYGADSSK